MDPFECARTADNMQLIRWIDKLSGSVNAGDLHGHTVLHWAAKAGHASTVDVLLSRGAMPNKRNGGGDTPLHNAVTHNKLSVVDKLILAHADVNAANEHGNTPLHYALFWRYTDVVDRLIKGGAHPLISNKYGRTPLDGVNEAEKARILKLAEAKKGRPMKKKSYVTLKVEEDERASLTLAPDLSTPIVVPFNFLTMGGLSETISDGEVFDAVWSGKGAWTGAKVSVKQFLKVDWSGDEVARFTEYATELRATVKCDYIRTILAISNSVPHLCVISNRSDQNLRTALRDPTRLLDEKSQLRYAIHVARGITWLHELSRSLSPLLHISTLTIKVGQGDRPQISADSFQYPHEFGKFDRVFHPEFAAPEVLMNKEGSYPAKPVDVFSFAMVFLEIVTRKAPWEAPFTPLSLGMAIAMDDARPPIPDYIRKPFRQLVAVTWVRDSRKRPPMVRVLATLEKMRKVMFKDPTTDSPNASAASVAVSMPSASPAASRPNLAKDATQNSFASLSLDPELDVDFDAADDEELSDFRAQFE